MLPTILCLSRSRQHAEALVERLQDTGVPITDISVLLLPTEAGKTPEPIKGLSFAHDQPAETTTATAATGGVAGAAAGVATMSLVGLTPLLMIAPLIVGTGAAIGAATGALASGLSDYGIPQTQLDHYQQRLVAGDLLVAVRTEDEGKLERAQSVFSEAGGGDIALFRLTKKLD